jgi:hypothetical protein
MVSERLPGKDLLTVTARVAEIDKILPADFNLVVVVVQFAETVTLKTVMGY